MPQVEHDENDGQDLLTQEDVERLLADSYISELAGVDRVKLTEFANLVADYVRRDWVSIPMIDLANPGKLDRK